MYKNCLLFLCFTFCGATMLFSQYKNYDVNFKKDALYMGTGIGLSILGTVLGNNADRSTAEMINAFEASDISRFDRGAVSNYSTTAQTFSDILLISGAALPIITYASKKCRTEGASIGIMAIETFLITNGITNITKSLTKRYRPFNYNPNVPQEVKLGRGSRFSFMSGHASNTAAMSFFSAKVLTDLHPEMKHKYIVWTVAATVPAAISYLRYEAGKHFPTDLIAGYAVGATIGYLIPSMHLSKNVQLNILGATGLNIRVNF